MKNIIIQMRRFLANARNDVEGTEIPQSVCENTALRNDEQTVKEILRFAQNDGRVATKGLSI